MDMKSRQKPISDKCANKANDQIADQSETAAPHHEAGQPSGNNPDKNNCQQTLIGQVHDFASMQRTKRTICEKRAAAADVPREPPSASPRGSQGLRLVGRRINIGEAANSRIDPQAASRNGTTIRLTALLFRGRRVAATMKANREV